LGGELPKSLVEFFCSHRRILSIACERGNTGRFAILLDTP